MRRRRFERCLKNATAALEAKDLKPAKDALAEARELIPDAPDIRALEQRVAQLEAPPVPAPTPVAVTAPKSAPPPRTAPMPAPTRPAVAPADLAGETVLRRHPPVRVPTFLTTDTLAVPVEEERPRSMVRAVLAIAAIGIFAVGGYLAAQFYVARPEPAATSPRLRVADGQAERRREPARPATAMNTPDKAAVDKAAIDKATNDKATDERPVSASERTPPPSTSLPSTAPPPAPKPTPTEPPPSTPTVTASRAPETAPQRTLEARNMPNVPEKAPEPPASRVTPAPPTASAAPAVERSEGLAPVSALPDRVATTGSAPSSPSSSAPAAPPATEPASEAVRASAKPAAKVDEAPQIRAVLARYESAYNRLDATAASSVYPGVNREALGRAFGGLISQRVSLGLCDITVMGDVGGASCMGKARWEPKVGSGVRTADRHWTFNLRRDTEGWHIEQVVVR